MDRSFPLCCVSPDSIFLWTLWLCLSFFIFLPLTFMSAPQFLLTLRLPSISWAIPIPGPLQNPLHPAPDWKSRAILETAPWSFFFSFQVIVYFQAIKRRSDTKEIEKGSSKSWGRFGWVSCAQASPDCATWKKRIGKGWDERKISSLEVQQSSWDLKVSARDQEFGKEWSERCSDSDLWSCSKAVFVSVLVWFPCRTSVLLQWKWYWDQSSLGDNKIWLSFGICYLHIG